MKITINGTSKEFTNNPHLSDLVNQFCKEPRHIITEVNGNIIVANNWGSTALKDGDTVELVAFVGGG